ncbi:Dipeptidase [Gryllus bimaculatus]|nr:Dipeptidase [Gryllus bimaculatus]
MREDMAGVDLRIFGAGCGSQQRRRLLSGKRGRCCDGVVRAEATASEKAAAYAFTNSGRSSHHARGTHNDLANNLRVLVRNRLAQAPLERNLSGDAVWGCADCHTDLPRLRAGRVAAQFWVAYVDCKTQYKDAVSNTLEQIDVIKRLIKKYPRDLQFADSVKGIQDAFKQKKIASLIAVEGGHSIDSSLPVLRLMYELGVRYLTLTHSCSTPWADSSAEENPKPNGITEFGKIVIHEMNRLGMMVDLSHVSARTMKSVIEVSKAPVIFSHSSAYSLCNHTRNVPDEILRMIPQNKGIVMVNFFSEFLVCKEERNATIEDVVDHINYIRNVTGVNHIGIGSDYDGVSKVPKGLEDVSSYPRLFERLAQPKPGEPTWSREDLKKLAGLNLLRVFREVEKVRDLLKTQGEAPSEALIPEDEAQNTTNCSTNKLTS